MAPAFHAYRCQLIVTCLFTTYRVAAQTSIDGDTCESALDPRTTGKALLQAGHGPSSTSRHWATSTHSTAALQQASLLSHAEPDEVGLNDGSGKEIEESTKSPPPWPNRMMNRTEMEVSGLPAYNQHINGKSVVMDWRAEYPVADEPAKENMTEVAEEPVEKEPGLEKNSAIQSAIAAHVILLVSGAMTVA